MAQSGNDVKPIFIAALDHEPGADRAAYLDAACGEDVDLRRRVEALLAAHERANEVLGDGGEPLATPMPEPSSLAVSSTAAYEPAAGPDILIAGRYKVRQEIGEGGMGSVYLAEQTQPIKRQVALKLIKPGMDSKTVLARFESERQALALMDHPHIAKVLDAGSTDTGRPFFVMELVKGIPLTDYCDQHRVGLLERLDLFRQICSAVQHAHHKGIIHRDLKPSNILIESHDGHPVPKVIDFGLAKATSGLQLTEHSVFSAFGTVAGTPLYMAPEQASLSALDVDTRADIYALGVILYELLTGTTPIARDTFKKAALDEILRLIREVEPPVPSSRISSSETRANIAAIRQTEPAKLGRFVRGDLDWIVMKALAKERSRRYESPIALAHDVERFLNHEAVSAGPPTAAYRLRKLLRRNRGKVIAASFVLLTLLVGLIGTTLALFEANRQRIRVDAQRLKAERRLTQVAKANEILGSVFEDLDPRKSDTDSEALLGLLAARLDKATAEIEEEAIGDPLAVARMQQTLGGSQLGLGFPEKAIVLLSKARATFTDQLGSNHPETLHCMALLSLAYKKAGDLGKALPLAEETYRLMKIALAPDDTDMLSAMNNLAACYQDAGMLDRSLPLIEQSYERKRAKLGKESTVTLVSMNNLATAYADAGKMDRAIPLLEEALALFRARLGDDNADSLLAMNNLAVAYQRAGSLDKAMPLFEDAFARRKARLGLDHPDTLTSARNLATIYQETGKLDRAMPLFEEALAGARAKLGQQHPATINHMHALAVAYHKSGKLDRALPLLEQALALAKTRLAPDHPETLRIMSALASGYQGTGQLERATSLFEETLTRRKAKLGVDHPDTLESMGNLAMAYRAARRHDQAIALLEQELALAKIKLPPNNPHTLTAMGNLATMYYYASKFDRAVPLLEETLAGRQAKFDRDHPETLRCMRGLANAYQYSGNPTKALPLFEETLARMKAKFGPASPDTIGCASNLADCYEAAGQLDRASPLLRELADHAKRASGGASPQYANALAKLGQNLLEQKAWASAEPVLRETLAIREAEVPDTWTTFNTKSTLGAALLGQKKYADAEPLLKAGYEGMKKRADKVPPQGKSRLIAAVDRLIALAEATGKPDDVKAWKTERAKW